MVIKIGSDPEFAVKACKGRRVLSASDIIRGSLHDEIGLDGCSDIGEFRPPPATTVEGHLKNIEKLIKQLLTEYPGYRFYGGSRHGGFSIGGHIHFSGVERTDELIRALDVLVALPVMLMEGDKAGRTRRKQSGRYSTSYGDLSDWRKQPHGGFEYRTLPSWLLSRVHAKTILDTAMLVVKNASNLPMAEIDAIGLHEWPAMGRFRRMDKDFFRRRGNVQAIFRILESLEGAEECKGSIDTLKEWTGTPHHWFQGVPLNGRWRLGKVRALASEVSSTEARDGTIIGTAADDRTESLAFDVAGRLDISSQFDEGIHLNYVIYGIRDEHLEDITCSQNVGEFIGSRNVVIRNRGRRPAPNQVRIGVSMRSRTDDYTRTVRIICRIIRSLEAEE